MARQVGQLESRSFDLPISLENRYIWVLIIFASIRLLAFCWWYKFVLVYFIKACKWYLAIILSL